jgi:hypothetical protein
VEDLFFDKFGRRFLPYAYFSARVFGLLLVLVSTGLWILGGWDSTVESTAFGSGAYGYGLHWSTVQTAFLAFYLIATNLQVGGYRSLPQVGAELQKDLRSVVLQFEAFGAFLVGRKTYGRNLFSNLRNEYREYANVDPVRGFSFAVLLAIVAGLFFELLWVPIYDITNFGQWAWPVYFYGAPLLNSPFLDVLFARNVLMLAVCAFFGATIFYAAYDGEGKDLVRRFRVSWRFDRKWLGLVLAGAGTWILWVFLPHAKFDPTQLFVNPSLIDSNKALTTETLLTTHWLFPSQGLFPQTEYTFYNATYFLKPYPASQVFGFYVNAPLVHLVNVVTKYATFAAVCYPALVRVEKRA